MRKLQYIAVGFCCYYFKVFTQIAPLHSLDAWFLTLPITSITTVRLTAHKEVDMADVDRVPQLWENWYPCILRDRRVPLSKETWEENRSVIPESLQTWKAKRDGVTIYCTVIYFQRLCRGSRWCTCILWNLVRKERWLPCSPRNLSKIWLDLWQSIILTAMGFVSKISILLTRRFMPTVTFPNTFSPMSRCFLPNTFIQNKWYREM